MATGVRTDPYERKRRRPERESADEPAGEMTSTDGYYSMHLDEK